MSYLQNHNNRNVKVNVEKTAMITIHDSVSYTPVGYIQDAGGQRVEGSAPFIKIVGFYFSSRPDVSLHVQETVKKVRRKYWIIRHLKRLGLTQQELVKVYTSILRSTVEFSSVVYGPMLTREQSNDLEHLQMQALKIIYGFDVSYRKILENTGLEKLEDRREKAIVRFAEKNLDSKFAHWFPRNESKRTRQGLEFKEERARTDRLRNSPIYCMRRRLNDH